MSLNADVRAFLRDMVESHDVMRFLHQDDATTFVPQKSPVLYSGPWWDNREIEAMFAAILGGKWITAGEHVHQFEAAFSRRFKSAGSLMVNSGSSANLVMIGALKKHFGWADDDEIVVSVVGFPTTVAPIVQNRLRPVFVDIEMESLNFDIDLIDASCADRTRAIFVSPVLGNAPDMDRIIELCERRRIHLVLDNCDSLGSRWRGRYLNEYAVASSCSFYPAHHISTGEGGMVSSDIDELVATARSLAWWGRDCYCVGAANLIPCGTCGRRFDRWLPDYDGVVDHRYVFGTMGYNLKPLDLQGAVGMVQLDKFDEIHRLRRESKRRMEELLRRHLSEVHVPGELAHAETCWFGTPIVCPDAATKQALVTHLEEAKIQTRNYFAGNILLHPAYAHLDTAARFPKANEVLDRVLFVGAAPHYHEGIFTYVDKVLGRFSPEADRESMGAPLIETTIDGVSVSARFAGGVSAMNGGPILNPGSDPG